MVQSSIQNQISLPGDVISPVHGFEIPASPAPNIVLDTKCFTYNRTQSSGTMSPKDARNDEPKGGAARVDETLPKSSSSDSGEGETPKTVHLLGYALSASSDGLEYCTTASSSEDV